MNNKNKKAFTIVELVIVIAVIAVLASVLIPTFSNATKKAKDTAFVTNGNTRYRELVTETHYHIDCFYNENTRYLLITDSGKVTDLGEYNGSKFSKDKNHACTLVNNYTILFNGVEIYSIDYIFDLLNTGGSEGGSGSLPQRVRQHCAGNGGSGQPAQTASGRGQIGKLRQRGRLVFPFAEHG